MNRLGNRLFQQFTGLSATFTGDLDETLLRLAGGPKRELTGKTVEADAANRPVLMKDMSGSCRQIEFFARQISSQLEDAG